MPARAPPVVLLAVAVLLLAWLALWLPVIGEPIAAGLLRALVWLVASTARR